MDECKLFSFHRFITICTGLTLETRARSPSKQLQRKRNFFQKYEFLSN